MFRFLLITLLLIPTLCLGIDLQKKAAEIKEEGLKLYRSERASWIATDIMMENNYGKLLPYNGGYFSYDADTVMRTVFYTNDSIPKVHFTIEFDKEFTEDGIKMFDFRREFIPIEKEYYDLKTDAIPFIFQDTSFLTYYQNTNFNPVILIDNNGKRIYFMTGTAVNGIIPLGNDYLFKFNNDNTLKSKEKLHNSLIALDFGQSASEEIIHTHLPTKDPFITATDICTSMLYAPYLGIKSCNVVSENYVSIWNIEKQSLLIMTTKAMKKVLDDVEKRKEQK